MASLSEIRQLFFVECEEQLEQLTDGLNAIEALPPGADPDAETVNQMFRAVHSMEGGRRVLLPRRDHPVRPCLRDDPRRGAQRQAAPDPRDPARLLPRGGSAGRPRRAGRR
ncbi:Hpt domain-containing protein [Oceaniglobus roseus]|uniref:Hpt domain-containing protein n=1 Tax=Oceaniglobus roseus TaxID=1737570 RepID=UPI001FED0F37|nr:Hpt domain-containing protein [Kandeliimicrobium roseum]